MNGQDARSTARRGGKQRIIGTKAAQVPPAWKIQPKNVGVGARVASGAPGANGVPTSRGSKVLLSNLPPDVSEDEITDLMTRTVGTISDTFIIYNNAGRTKGMAVVTFNRTEDAANARKKYNGKLIDGRKPLKIEIILDTDAPSIFGGASAPPRMPSLLERMNMNALNAQQAAVKHTPKVMPQPVASTSRPQPPKPINVQPRPIPVMVAAHKPRFKKGPRRVNKPAFQPRLPVNREQLDQDMDLYRAQAPSI